MLLLFHCGYIFHKKNIAIVIKKKKKIGFLENEHLI